MSRMGLYGFRYNGEDKLTLVEEYAYPDALGREIVQFVRDTGLHIMKDLFQKIIMVGRDVKATDAQVTECEQYSAESGSHDWLALLYKSRGDLTLYRDGKLIYMVDDQELIKLSLYCDWAYVINLDTNELEIWKGSQREPHPNRYGIEPTMHMANDYYPCSLIITFPLDDIPDDWTDIVSRKIRNDDSKAIVHSVRLDIRPYGHVWTVYTDKGIFKRGIDDELCVIQDDIKDNNIFDPDLIACLIDTWGPQAVSKIIKEY